MKLKAGFVAVALALGVAGHASAALTDATGGNSALIFSAWDFTTNASYTRALGSNLNTWANDLTIGSFPTNLTFTPDALFTSLFGSSVSSSTFQWNVVAADSNALAGAGDSPNRNRVISTTEVQNPTSPSRGQNAAAGQNLNTYLGNLNAAPVSSTCGALGTNTGSCGSTSLADNWNINNPASAWGGGLGVPAGFLTAGTIGESLFFLFTSSTGATSSAVNTQASFGGAPVQWTLASNGTLTFDPTVASVPVPAAVWLLGSGLMGLIGVARRGKETKKGGSKNLAAA